MYFFLLQMCISLILKQTLCSMTTDSELMHMHVNTTSETYLFHALKIFCREEVTVNSVFGPYCVHTSNEPQQSSLWSKQTTQLRGSRSTYLVHIRVQMAVFSLALMNHTNRAIALKFILNLHPESKQFLRMGKIKGAFQNHSRCPFFEQKCSKAIMFFCMYIFPVHVKGSSELYKVIT